MLKVNQEMQVRKRDGRTLSFDRELIARAIRKAFRADLGLNQLDPIEPEQLSDIEQITDRVVHYVKNDAETDAGGRIVPVRTKYCKSASNWSIRDSHFHP